jgi:hypothetical protein
LPRITGEIEDALLASGLPIFSRAGALVEPVAETMLAAGGGKTVVARLRATPGRVDHTAAVVGRRP